MVVVQEPTASLQNKVTKFFQAKPWGFWHYISNYWLVSGVPDSYTPKKLFAELVKAVPELDKVRTLVLETHTDTPRYWGTAPSKAWTWMSKHWGSGG